jgi:hypothetical protein
MINFSFGLEDYRGQLEKVVEVISSTGGRSLSPGILIPGIKHTGSSLLN